ncbi:MAG: Mn transporter, partial [Syntrophus sp. (in: bacteria)]|nr:Mn transporter [Syntrophus sp. (in: bacteria)]
EAPQFYGLYSLMVFLGAGIILLPDMPLITIMFYSQVINGAILPVILIFMLLLVNDRKIMGEYTNSLAMNIISWLTVAILTVLCLTMLAFALFTKS